MPIFRFAFVTSLAALAGSLSVACDNAASKPAPSVPASTSAAHATGAAPTAAAPTEKVPMPEKTEAARAGAAINAFGASLYPALAKKPGNFVFSPTSISAALSMTLGGAKAETAAEMQKALHVSQGDVALMGRLLRGLGSPGRPLTLNVANRLFGEKTFAFEAPFVERTRADFGAPLEAVDFVGAPDAARGKINGWVEEKTERRIKQLLPPTAINATTRLVLVNALYFLAEWDSPFKKEATMPRPFKAAGGDKAVPTMHQRVRSRVAAAGGARMLELRYKGRDTAMIVVLPDAPDGLAAVEKQIAGAKLGEWQTALAGATEQDVDVALPKLTLEPGAPVLLSDPLKALGMVRAFDAERADLSGIGVPKDPKNRLYVSEVFHKAFVKVDEKGTEAAAATAVVSAEGAGMPPKAISFQVDRPFVFLIVDKTSNATLFVGRVVDPS